MAVKLVVSDLDGTLIGKDEIVHDFIPDMINTLKCKGIHFTIATGRTPNLSKAVVERLGLEDPCVMGNGSMIVQQNKVLESRMFKLQPLRDIIQYAGNCGMSIIFAGEETDTVLRKTPWLEKQYELFGRYSMEFYPSEEEWKAIQIPKLTIWDKTNRIERITDELMETFNSMYSITKYDSSCVEVAPENCNKLTGIELLAKRLNLQLNEIMAIGDHYNDLEMISAVGTGVAMGAAPEALKQNADYICEKPLAYGVLEAVERYCY